MATFTLNGYDSYSGCDILVTARLNKITGASQEQKEKVYTLGSLQTLSVSTHQDKKPVRVIGSMNALDYTMGQRTIAGSLVFAVFDKHFATLMFEDLKTLTGKTFLLPDELPAMDLTVTFANEYGRISRMAIYGLRLINEGQVMSINDLYTENTYQFVATALEPLREGTGNGVASDKDDVPEVNSNNSINPDISTNHTGEDIVTNSSYSTGIERVLLSAEIEQPVYFDQDGIVRLFLSPEQETGYILIHNQMTNSIIHKIQITDELDNYIAFLKPGLYSAWYENQSEILSNTVSLAINVNNSENINFDDTPIIEEVTSHSISLYSNNTSHTHAICYSDDNKNTVEIELKSRKATFEELDANTSYHLCTRNNSTVSRLVSVKTLKLDNDHAIDFKSYVKNNKNLLSKSINEYEPVLNSINKNILQDIEKVINNRDDEELSDNAKEVMFLASKYHNEYIQSINWQIFNTIPKKDNSNIYGNTITFDSGVVKANIFSNKNNKEYFEHTEPYPYSINYLGKANTLYSSNSIDESFIKSPKYMFFSYSDNDKHMIKELFGNANALDKIDLSKYNNVNATKKYSNEILQCLAVMDNKHIDLKLLKAPFAKVVGVNDLEVNLECSHLLSNDYNKLFLSIAKIEESLDTTSFRKIEITDITLPMLITNYESAFNDTDVFVLWIEDERFNIISEMSFVSTNELIENFSIDKFNNLLNSISKEISLNEDQKNALFSISLDTDCNFNNIYLKIAQSFIDDKTVDSILLLEQLFKSMFKGFYTNIEKYKTAVINKEERTICFTNAKKVYHIGFKKYSEPVIEIIEGDKTMLNSDMDYSLYYVIDSNPIIKSGFVLSNNREFIKHNIGMEVI